jgi:hypothetical protein
MFIIFVLDRFTGIDYLTTVIKRLFLEKNSNDKFFLQYLNSEDEPPPKSWCRKFWDEIIRFDEEKMDLAKFKDFQDERACETFKV